MAIGMQKKAAETGIPVRMGIDSGICTVSNFGSDRKMEYTIIDNAMNTASRLKATAEPRKILVSEAIKKHVDKSIDCELNGRIRLRKIENDLTAYWVSTSN
jgi:class 3 adenylate cyclase